jgi:uncharacterized SAM-dependent methyltransferase
MGCSVSLKKISLRNNKQPFKTFSLRVNLENYPEAQFIRGTSILVPKEHAQTVYETSVVEEKYWYWDEKGAATYIMMTQEEGYDVLSKTYGLLERNISHITEKAFEFFRVAHPTQGSLPQIELVVLGVGSATKENLILKNIIHKYGHPHRSRFGPLNYVPVDISFPLLQNSLRSIFGDPDLKECILRGNLLVSPVLTDFLTGLTGFLGKHTGKLIVAQGIVWNAPILDLFAAFRRLMSPDSLLLIDVEFVGGRTDEQITSNYRGEAAKDFFYHPLALLYSASQTKQNDYFFNKSGQAVSYRSAFAEFSEKKGEINPVIVQRSTLEEFASQYNLPEEAKSRIRLSPAEKSKTVVVLYNQKTQPLSKTVILGYSTRFEYDEFKKFLEKAEFEPLGEWLDYPEHPERAVFGHYLLRLKNQRTPHSPALEQREAPHSAQVGPPWTQEEICQDILTNTNGRWRVETDKYTGTKMFNVTAEKKRRFGQGGGILVCDIEKDELTVMRMENFLEKVGEARKHMSKISKAALFCDKHVTEDVYTNYERKKKVALPSLSFYLVQNKNDLISLEKDL